MAVNRIKLNPLKIFKVDKKGGEDMRKLLLVTLVVSLVLGIVSLASATPLPLQEEVNVWRWDEEYEEWVLETPGPTANARAWQQGDVLSGYCNKETWDLDLATHTSVAQWIKWQLSAQGWRIYVRKPGIYTGDCISGSIKSNAEVKVWFSGFGDLKNTAGEAIETFYSFGQEAPNNITDWYPAKTLDQQVLMVPYCEHSAHLWVKIVVREDPDDLYPKTRACEYQDDAQIKLSVTVYKPWLDQSGNGNFPQQ